MDFLDWFDCLCPEEVVILSTTLGIAIASNMNASEANSFGNFLQSLGQNIETIASQKALNESDCS